MAKNFSATVDAWCLKVEKRLEVIVKQSTQDLIEVMNKAEGKGGNMPVVTGFLRSSLRVTIGQPASGLVDRPDGDENTKYSWGEERSYSLTILGAPLGKSIYAVYLANYAVYQEYGANGMAGKGFRRLAAQQWPQIVAKNVQKAKAIK